MKKPNKDQRNFLCALACILLVAISGIFNKQNALILTGVAIAGVIVWMLYTIYEDMGEEDW